MVYYPQYNYNTIKWNDDIYNDDIFVIKITKLFYSSRCPPLPPCPQLHSGRPRASKKFSTTTHIWKYTVSQPLNTVQDNIF